MKVIPTNELAEMFQNHCSNYKSFDIHMMEKLFEKYGDEYFIVDGTWELCTINQERKKLLE